MRIDQKRTTQKRKTKRKPKQKIRQNSTSGADLFGRKTCHENKKIKQTFFCCCVFLPSLVFFLALQKIRMAENKTAEKGKG